MVSAALDGREAVPAPARIWAIEGLRAWLAWAVVFAHVVQICGIDRDFSHWWITQFLATEAVKVFIIISGFVIANVLLARRESWRRFMTRRAFRIFPIYLLLLPLGALTMRLVVEALPYMGWAQSPAYTYDDTAHATIASVDANPLGHIAPHLLLLQGVIPDSVLERSQTSFLGPAWSLSLEWQFYLIAPLMVWLLTRRAWSAFAIGALFLLAAAAQLGLFGRFDLPSFFPALGYLFALGVVSRLIFEPLKRARFHAAAVAVACVAAGVLFREIFAIAVWAAFLATITGRAAVWHERIAARAADAAFCSRTALMLGARSYAVYLAHWPVIQALAFVILPLAPFTQWQAFALLAPAVALVTLAAAELLHVFVEKPFIRLGATLASAPPHEAPRRAVGGEA